MSRTVIVDTEAYFLLLRSCHAGRPGHDVALLYGTNHDTITSVHMVLSAEDPPWKRSDILRAAKELGYVQVGQARLVSDAIHDNPRQPHKARIDDTVITPPESYVFLLRHRIACRSYLRAAAFNNDTLTPINVTLKNDKH